MTNNVDQWHQPVEPNSVSRWRRSAGKVRPMILLWALGVPVPIVLIIFLIRGCT